MRPPFIERCSSRLPPPRPHAFLSLCCPPCCSVLQVRPRLGRGSSGDGGRHLALPALLRGGAPRRGADLQQLHLHEAPRPEAHGHCCRTSFVGAVASTRCAAEPQRCKRVQLRQPPPRLLLLPPAAAAAARRPSRRQQRRTHPRSPPPRLPHLPRMLLPLHPIGGKAALPWPATPSPAEA
jgi:hypothetical protein